MWLLVSLSRSVSPSPHVVFFPTCLFLPFFPLHFYVFCSSFFTPCCFSFYCFDQLLFIGAEPAKRRDWNAPLAAFTREENKLLFWECFSLFSTQFCPLIPHSNLSARTSGQVTFFFKWNNDCRRCSIPPPTGKIFRCQYNRSRAMGPTCHPLGWSQCLFAAMLDKLNYF